ncbi:MAG: hypothetical protein EPO40_18770 [Myxococcaceae bacterium]|nr:MAG: hypothetical protein EPO40_18770 [Myxococcaceae bacterium]
MPISVDLGAHKIPDSLTPQRQRLSQRVHPWHGSGRAMPSDTLPPPTRRSQAETGPRRRRKSDPSLGAWSLRGPVRQENQDRVRVAWVGDTALIVMADGVGGQPLGGEAAEVVTNHAFRRLRRELPTAVGVEGVRTLLLSTVWSAAGSLSAEAQARGIRPSADGLRTTLILAVALADTYVVAWLGDGGACVLRGKAKTEQLLEPHKSPDAPTLLEASLGPETDGTPNWAIKPRQPGDTFLVSTDGVADRFDAAVAAKLHTAIARSKGHAKWALQDFLADLTRQKNAVGRFTFTDNVTAALVLTDGTPATAAPGAEKRGSIGAAQTVVVKTRHRDRTAARVGSSH